MASDRCPRPPRPSGFWPLQLTDRISWGNIAKSLIFMPMAISFVGAAVIFKLVYDARPEDVAQIGVLNAILVQFGADPVQWLTVPFWNNFFLMIVLIWIQTGFAMVILSAALRGIPEETIEAAIVDGANPFQVFFKIKMPQITGTIVVVWTTITIVVLKGLRHRLRHDQRPVGDAGAGQLHVRQDVPRQRLGHGIGRGHDHHADGHADPRLERLTNARKEMR